MKNEAAQQLGKLSWEARKLKHGEQKALDILKEAAKKGGRPKKVVVVIDKPSV